MRKQITQATRAWYFKDAIKPTFGPAVYDEVGFGRYDEDGGCFGEAKIVFYDFSRSRVDKAIALHIFGDGFKVLAEDAVDLMAEFADADNPSPNEVIAFFLGRGYSDATEESGPLARRTR